ncbi:hypothetical protein GR138_04245 [Shinella kummerowiae]|jgi:hypothetical protein|uniref:Uncharacterized protein n=1 Tax=Shinella kummerowiae TaxID=417745 RepID=A0A6N8S5T8_9HYPH|nr:hypothetical protein [Shinella kummerowiae]MXN44389.1 hypothetical protein [Shinella kummerowiae]
MSQEHSDDKVKIWLNQITRWPIVAGMIVSATALGGAVTLYDSIKNAAERASSLLSVPEVVGIAVSTRATGMSELYRIGQTSGLGRWTFKPNDVQVGSKTAILTFTLSNPLNEGIVLTEVIYDVSEIQKHQMRGTASGPLTPLTTYVHDIEHRIGSQRKKLSPPFVIDGKSSASFDIQIISSAADYVANFELKMGFVSQEYITITPNFGLTLPKGQI